MRLASIVPVCVVVAASTMTATANVPASKPWLEPAKELRILQRHVSRTTHILPLRSIAAQLDNQVIANLLSDAPARANDLPLTVLAGEIARCESRTCQVPVNIRVEGAQGPVTLALAVANPNGQLSAVRHIECGTGDCAVSLILERGENVISVGVLDGVSQTTGFTTMHVHATRSMADRGKSEWF